MADHILSFHLQSADQTAQFARALGRVVEPGDTILLSGDVGSGKTHFARSLIQSLLTVAEDVPSPTFTLVQTYDTTAGSLWHADLYRLTSSVEIEELGLIDAFDSALCLVEWPDRLGRLRPTDALDLTLQTTGDDTRQLHVAWSDPKWTPKLEVWHD